ncbi:DNA translocase FtsK, partial [Sphingomonas sp. TF3]|uniref:DNA translocase FtsK n=1 Tax=Sphingomonas sp. TF3 TaxID=2495580 RepID=UPI000F91ABF8
QVLPQIVVIVDELAEVIDGLPDENAYDELRMYLQRISNKGPVAGLHMILSSNRWVVEHLDAVIGTQSSARITYRLVSSDESETFLGRHGAEELNKPGDMIFMPRRNHTARLYGAFVSDEEVNAVSDHWRAQNVHAKSIADFDLSFGSEPETSPEHYQYIKAIELVIENQQASTSWLQRQLRVGYNSTARIIERMEKEGIVGRPDHVGRRSVLLGRDGHPKPASAMRPVPSKKSWWPWAR